MSSRRLAWLFLGLLTLGVMWPVVAGAMSCGDCCEGGMGDCGVPTTGFSLCCLHSASILPELPPASPAPAEGVRLSAADETEGPPPDPRSILHVPLLT
jgi:hypothetical protein